MNRWYRDDTHVLDCESRFSLVQSSEENYGRQSNGLAAGRTQGFSPDIAITPGRLTVRETSLRKGAAIRILGTMTHA